MEKRMIYAEFKARLIKELEEKFMCEGELQKQTVIQSGDRMLTGLHLEKESSGIACTIFIEDLYRDYLEHGDFNLAVLGAGELLQREAPEFMRNRAVDITPEYIKENVFCELLGGRYNQEFLRTVPHLSVKNTDLAITYRCMVGEDSSGIAAFFIHPDLMAYSGMTLKELHQTALSNTQRMFPMEIMELAPEMKAITNQQKVFGATAILYPGVLEAIAEKENSDFYLLPSSIHEMILVPDQGNFSEKELRWIVRSANQEVVAPNEVLSDSIYRYKKDERKLERCKEPTERQVEQDR
ncbi:DUF5688 family protein [Zhenpiania hominis]|uniref:Uncharacterized protein n=1 Tax=Zhenpiania hominis TaxID=2763644 RepID=A0A923SRP9_9FIRM|nr:DUF5688 family protein [Zhenpiania hominis]MBC6679544.1 hypothetical protein [Zhenpiania hominis]